MNLLDRDISQQAKAIFRKRGLFHENKIDITYLPADLYSDLEFEFNGDFWMKLFMKNECDFLAHPIAHIKAEMNMNKPKF